MVVVVVVMRLLLLLRLLLQKQREPDRHQRANTATRDIQQSRTWMQGLHALLISMYNK